MDTRKDPTPLRHVAKIPQANSNIALVGLGSIALGTMMAVAGVPNDLSRPDALFLPALYMTIGLILPVTLQIRSNLTALLRVENALMVGIIYWLLLDMLQSAYPFNGVLPAHVEYAFVMVGAFASAIWLGATGVGWRLPRAIEATAVRMLTTKTIFIATLIAFILGMAKFAIASGFNLGVMIEGLGAERWGSPWARGDLGGADAFLDHMQYFGYIMPALSVVLALRVGWFNWRVLTALLLSAIVVAFLAQSGGRRIIGVVIGAALFTWAASRPRLGPKLILGAGTAIGLLLLFMQEMLRYRNVGFAAWWAGERPEQFVEYIHVDDNFLRLAQLIKFYPDYIDFVYYQPILHALTLPIPRIFWPGKPTGPGFDLPLLLGYEGVSLSCSIVGELYVSFGVWAVLGGGWIIGRLAGMWNKVLQLPSGASRPLMYGLGLMALFAGLRSAQALVQMSYIVLAWIFVTTLLPRLSEITGWRRREPGDMRR